MVNAEEWEYDMLAAKKRSLPDPFGGETEMEAWVWADGHIAYNHREWIYDGVVAKGRPEGRGVLTGGFEHKGCRYEGEFHAGRCHGKGCFVNPNANIAQDGNWVDGHYQEPNAANGPITLHARHGHRHWSMSSDKNWEHRESDINAQLGKIDMEGFGTFEIARIEKSCITITHWDETYLLACGGTLKLSNEIEGREWSDGCVYDGDEYTLELTWVTQ